MKPKIFTTEELEKYFSGQLKHACWQKTVDLARRLAIHSDGSKDGYGSLISERRPGESEWIKDYRIKIIVEKTKQTFSSVLTELGKMRKADDWSIRHPKEEVSKKIRDGETLYDYCEVNYPKFKSITDWAFKALLKKYAVDSHCAILIMPLEEVGADEFKRPYPFLFPAANVYEFEENKYAILLSNKKSTYSDKDGKNTYQDGKIFYVVNTISIQRWEQIDPDGRMQMKLQTDHNFGYLPVRLTQGVVSDTSDEDPVWESRFMAMAPSLDEAIREYSDLQAAIVQHMHPEKAVIKNQKCPDCQLGKVLRQGKDSVQTWQDCTKCGGSGMVATSPYSNYAYEPQKAGEQEIPWPPVIYIDKPGVADMIKLQNERVSDHQFEALASINMQFLHKVPLSESGVSKEVDRDALNTLVNLVCEDIISIIDWNYKVTNDWRYILLVPDERERNKWLPKVNVPVNFQILSSGYLIDEITKARGGKVSPIIVNHLELEYANKMFNADSSVKDQLANIFELDPLSGYTIDDKNAMAQNNGITDTDYVMSCNIREFIKAAIAKDKTFSTKTYEEKRKILEKMAGETIKKTQAASKIENPLDPNNPNPEPAQ